MPAPVVQRYSTKKALVPVTFRFGGGIGAFEHDSKRPDVGAVMTNGDDRFGYLMPGPREVVDRTGIAAGFRVIDHVKHNDVDILATTDGTDTKVYRMEGGVWALKETVASKVCTCVVSMHDGTNSILAVGYGSGAVFRYSTNDGTSWTASTLSGNKARMTTAYVQQDGVARRVCYVVDPDLVYFGLSLVNGATVSTPENVGSGNATDDYFTSVAPDDQGNLIFGKRHLAYRRVVLADSSVNYEIITPYFDDPLGDAGGQSDRRNFENPVNIMGRLFYPVNGYTLGMWYQGNWSTGLEPREAGVRIPRLDLPINALARAGRWLVLALGSKNTASLKTMTNAPGGTNLLQNTFTTTSELYLGELVAGGDAIRWHGSVLTCTDPLRYMWFDENDSYLYLASGDSESANAQQNRCLLYTDDPIYHTVSGAVTLSNGTVTAEFGMVTGGTRDRKLLRHASLRATGLTSSVTAALKYRNESGRNTTGAYKTHATYGSVEAAARGTDFPTSRTFEEMWLQVVLTGSSNSYAVVDRVNLLAEVL